MSEATCLHRSLFCDLLYYLINNYSKWSCIEQPPDLEGHFILSLYRLLKTYFIAVSIINLRYPYSHFDKVSGRR